MWKKRNERRGGGVTFKQHLSDDNDDDVLSADEANGLVQDLLNQPHTPPVKLGISLGPVSSWLHVSDQ